MSGCGAGFSGHGGSQIVANDLKQNAALPFDLGYAEETCYVERSKPSASTKENIRLILTGNRDESLCLKTPDMR
jgi:hypothetical protein